MDTTGLQQVVRRMIDIDDAEFQAFVDQLRVRKLKKGEILWDIGAVCNDVGFITKGLMRYFFYRNDTEVTGQFFFENTFVTVYSSIITGQSSHTAFQALEEVELLMISKEALYKLFDRYKSWERFGRLMAEHTVVIMQRVRAELTATTPKEKYLQLIRERPRVLERVPLHLIASYLDMTPEHLSRVRREIAQSKS